MLGCVLGELLGCVLGIAEGWPLGSLDGAEDGWDVGQILTDGCSDGFRADSRSD